jgi:hypothetical protein
LRGSDGRFYALEMTRLTPRDANYVKTRGTGKISEADLEKIDENVCVAYVLRDELIQSYKEVYLSLSPFLHMSHLTTDEISSTPTRGDGQNL